MVTEMTCYTYLGHIRNPRIYAVPPPQFRGFYAILLSSQKPRKMGNGGNTVVCFLTTLQSTFGYHILEARSYHNVTKRGRLLSIVRRTLRRFQVIPSKTLAVRSMRVISALKVKSCGRIIVRLVLVIKYSTVVYNTCTDVIVICILPCTCSVKCEHTCVHTN